MLGNILKILFKGVCMNFIDCLNGKKTAIAASIMAIIGVLKVLGINVPIDTNDISGIIGGVIQVGSIVLGIIGVFHKIIKSGAIVK